MNLSICKNASCKHYKQERNKLSSCEKTPITAGPNLEAVGVTETLHYIICFLSSKHIRVLSLFPSGSVSRALSASCHSLTVRFLAHFSSQIFLTMQI